MDMRCDSVDIAKFLGAYGPAATHVNQQQINGDNKRHNETKKQINNARGRVINSFVLFKPKQEQLVLSRG